MPLRTAQVGDTVAYRNVDGQMMNVVVTGTQPSAPAAPSVTSQATGGTLGAGTYSYRVSRVRGGAEGPASPAGSTTVAAGTTNQCTITLPGERGVRYRIYGRTAGSEQFIAETAEDATQYVDTGAITPGPPAATAVTADGRIGARANHLRMVVQPTKATAPKQTGRYYLR